MQKVPAGEQGRADQAAEDEVILVEIGNHKKSVRKKLSHFILTPRIHAFTSELSGEYGRIGARPRRGEGISHLRRIAEASQGQNRSFVSANAMKDRRTTSPAPIRTLSALSLGGLPVTPS